jgi:hypothetical protein
LPSAAEPQEKPGETNMLDRRSGIAAAAGRTHAHHGMVGEIVIE